VAYFRPNGPIHRLSHPDTVTHDVFVMEERERESELKLKLEKMQELAREGRQLLRLLEEMMTAASRRR